MSDPRPSFGFLDRLVEWIAEAMNGLGLNGTRLQWRWRQQRLRIGERGLRGEMTWRSARGKHKMCPACRALVDRGESRCTECGASLSAVQAPGVGRVLANAMPGGFTATSLLLLVNGLLFAMMLVWPAPDSGQSSGLGRLMGFDFFTRLRFGSGFGLLIVEDGEWFRLITAIFLHHGILHFGMNTLALMQLGRMAEEIYGAQRFWVAYLASGIAGSLVSQLPASQWKVGVIGASGAICGIVGLLLAHGIRRGPAGEGLRRMMLQYTLAIAVFSLFPGVSLLAHAGGLAGGFLMGFVVPVAAPRTAWATNLWQILSLIGVLAVLSAFYGVALHGQDFARYLD